MTFVTGSYIQNRRIKLGMSQRQLALLAQVSPNYISLIENNRVSPSEACKTKIYSCLKELEEKNKSAVAIAVHNEQKATTKLQEQLNKPKLPKPENKEEVNIDLFNRILGVIKNNEKERKQLRGILENIRDEITKALN